jgi:hypothetical protein
MRAQLGLWNARAAYLVAIGRRLRAHGRRGPSYAEEAEALALAVGHQKRLLADQIQYLPPDVSVHPHLTDAQRALDHVAMTLEEARQLL